MHACLCAYVQYVGVWFLLFHEADYAEAESVNHQSRDCFNVIFIRIIPWIGDPLNPLPRNPLHETIENQTPAYQKRNTRHGTSP